MQHLNAGKRFHCLDLLQIASSAEAPEPYCDCAILLEVWDSGGLMQASRPIPLESTLTIPSIGDGFEAQVVSCQGDAYGFMVEISVHDPRWFPGGYVPPHVLPDKS